MLEHIQLNRVMVIDIETVPIAASYDDLPEVLKPLWDKRASRFQKHDDDSGNAADLFLEKAGIYAEFGRIICIAAGVFSENEDGLKFRIKTFADEDERQLLFSFSDMMDKHLNPAKNFICAHNGREFDYPFISRRMLVNKVRLPSMLNIFGKKPWETSHLLDTMDMWRFGDFKNYTSLELLAALFDIKTPKDDIKGSDVARIYRDEKDLNRIIAYCRKDIITLAGLLMKFKNMDPLSEDQIILTD